MMEDHLTNTSRLCEALKRYGRDVRFAGDVGVSGGASDWERADNYVAESYAELIAAIADLSGISKNDLPSHEDMEHS